jgi:DNA polymerase-3 subunit delta'
MWNTIGHDSAVALLRRSLDEGRLAHAYMITGPRHLGKMTLAMDLARAVNCTASERPCGECAQCDRISRGLHTDVKIVEVDKDQVKSRVMIAIDQVREMQREVSLAPFEGASRVIIIDQAERLSEEAANGLLKTLEEPPDQVVLVLLAPDTGVMATTLSSRCQILELKRVSGATIVDALIRTHGIDASSADQIARIARGRPGWAFRAAEDPEILEDLSNKLEELEEIVAGNIGERFAHAAGIASAFDRDREAGRRDMDMWLDWWRDLMLVKAGTPEFMIHVSRLEPMRAAAAKLTAAQIARTIAAIGETVSFLERNVNSRLALEQFFLSLPRPR